ncbi:MAG TPA: MarR family transcriptional regulator [Armatimonadota bacterium]
MKLLGQETNTEVLPEECAAQLMEVMPVFMQTIRSEIRSHRPANLSVPQFRVMLYLLRHAGASLSDVAEQQGVALPSASKMVDSLVKRGYIAREYATDDRRRVTLQLTPQGTSSLDEARKQALAHVGQTLAGLSDEERGLLVAAMHALRRVLPNVKAE